MADEYLTPEVKAAQQQSYNLTEQAGNAAANAFKMPQLLREAVAERFKESPLNAQFGTAAQNFLNAVPAKRTELAGLAQSGQAVMSPNQQQQILTANRAANIVPLISLNDLLQNQFGKSQELVTAGTGAYQSYAQGLQNAAELSRMKYSDMLNALTAQRNYELAQASAAESTRQFNETLAFNKSNEPAPPTMDIQNLWNQFVEENS